jgi:hypothetical protein
MVQIDRENGFTAITEPSFVRNCFMAGGAVLVRSQSYGGPVSLKDSYFPVALVTTLVLRSFISIYSQFFLWGFAYGMLDVLNKVPISFLKIISSTFKIHLEYPRCNLPHSKRLTSVPILRVQCCSAYTY